MFDHTLSLWQGWECGKENVWMGRLQMNSELFFAGLLQRSEVKSLSRVRLFATPWTCQASLSMGFSRQEYWNGLPFPYPGDLPDPGIEPRSPAPQADSLPSELRGKCPWSTQKKRRGAGTVAQKKIILHMSGYNPLVSLQANHQTLYSGSKGYITICLFFPFYQSLEVLPNLSF